MNVHLKDYPILSASLENVLPWITLICNIYKWKNYKSLQTIAREKGVFIALIGIHPRNQEWHSMMNDLRPTEHPCKIKKKSLV
jgi:hypothetical protein